MTYKRGDSGYTTFSTGRSPCQSTGRNLSTTTSPLGDNIDICTVSPPMRYINGMWLRALIGERERANLVVQRENISIYDRVCHQSTHAQ